MCHFLEKGAPTSLLFLGAILRFHLNWAEKKRRTLTPANLEPCVLIGWPRVGAGRTGSVAPATYGWSPLGTSLFAPEKGRGTTSGSYLASVTSCLLKAILVMEALAVITASREQIEFLHSVLNMFLLTIYSLFVSLLIEGGKEVIFFLTPRGSTVLILVDFIITRSIQSVLVDYIF